MRKPIRGEITLKIPDTEEGLPGLVFQKDGSLKVKLITLQKTSMDGGVETRQTEDHLTIKTWSEGPIPQTGSYTYSFVFPAPEQQKNTGHAVFIETKFSKTFSYTREHQLKAVFETEG